MNTFYRAFFIAVLSICLFSLNAYAEDDLKLAAIKKLQNAVVKALPDESDIARIAILDFEGDDGTIKNAITSVITEKTTFKVIERADLDKILEEQGLQLKDIMDEQTRITHGRIKGVQGLLMGKVLSMKEGFMSYDIKVHLKLDDVEKGEIVVSKDFSASAVSPVRNWIFIGAIGMIVILIVITMLKKRRAAVIDTTIKEDVTVRVDLTKELGKALTNLSEAKAKLMDKGKSDEAILLKDAERELQLLKEHVDNAARGSADMHKAKVFKEVLDFDTRIKSSFEELTKSADRIYDIVLSGNTENLEKEVAVLKRDIKNTMSDFKNRGF